MQNGWHWTICILHPLKVAASRKGRLMAGRCVFWELEAPVPVKHVRIQLVESNHLNLAEVELLISKDFADALGFSPEADERNDGNYEQWGTNWY